MSAGNLLETAGKLLETDPTCWKWTSTHPAEAEQIASTTDVVMFVFFNREQLQSVSEKIVRVDIQRDAAGNLLESAGICWKLLESAGNACGLAS